MLTLYRPPNDAEKSCIFETIYCKLNELTKLYRPSIDAENLCIFETVDTVNSMSWLNFIGHPLMLRTYVFLRLYTM